MGKNRSHQILIFCSKKAFYIRVFTVLRSNGCTSGPQRMHPYTPIKSIESSRINFNQARGDIEVVAVVACISGQCVANGTEFTCLWWFCFALTEKD